MIGANKILTVSYGTFSCTLEGFDEPFNTMKAIAEYFRDLAAEDRYFGAEPPQPDAAMLHRIAEREIQRRVEARVEENNLILKADGEAAPAPVVAPAVAAAAPAAAEPDVAAPAVATAPAAAPQPAVEPVIAESAVAEAAAPAPAASEQVAPAAEAVVAESALAEDMAPEAQAAVAADFAREAEPAPKPEPEPEPEMPRLAPAMPEGVAAKLARLRRAVSQSAGGNVVSLSVLPPVAPALSGDMDFIEDEPADVPGMEAASGLMAGGAPEEAMAEVGMDVAEDSFDDVDVPELADDLAGDFAPEAAESAPGDMAEPEAQEAVAVAETVEEEEGSEDDMLARLALAETVEPAVVAEDETEAEDESEALGTLIATLAGGAPDGDEIVDEMDDAVAEAAEADPFAMDDAVAGDDELYELAETPETPAMARDDLGDLNDDLPEALAEDLARDELAVEELAVEDLSEDDLSDEEMADLAALDDAAPEAEVTPQETGDFGVDLVETAAAAPAVEAEPEPEADGVLAEKVQRARARVIKIRRADATLPPPAAAPAAEDLPRADAEPAPGDALAAGSGEDDVERLSKRADDEMAGPENQRRLAAIKHLKAAVAATVAERRAGVTAPSDEDRADPYRADLARVVRPVRPRAAESGSALARPAAPAAAAASEARPAPLVLVSAQRIDRPATPVMPVRPRRVGGGGAAAAAAVGMTLVKNTAAPVADASDWDEDEEDNAPESGNIFADARDFGEFAEALGATGLPALLEAAAAYATLVEKREHFTRPLLMRRLTSDETGAKITREEGLRSFGTLLREGRIEKVRRGQYALPEDSALLAEARRISG